MLKGYLKVLFKLGVYLRQSKDTFTSFSRGLKKVILIVFCVVTSPCGIFVILSLVIIFSQILKKASPVCNVINEVQVFCYIIFKKLKFFFPGTFLSIGCFFRVWIFSQTSRILFDFANLNTSEIFFLNGICENK